MRVRLLDANLLIALAWPVHAHHGAVMAWFRGCSVTGWATCPFTETAFVRVSANPRMLPHPTSPKAAMLMVDTLTQSAGYQFWSDDIPLRSAFESVANVTGHKQISDVYLLALAMRHGGTLATLDFGISSLLPAKPGHESFVELVKAT